MQRTRDEVGWHECSIGREPFIAIVRRRRATMRDKRFVAAHRGGPLTLPEHRLLAAWAADCAEHLLPLFELHSWDSRPRLAIEVGRAWVRGELKTGAAQRAAVAAHAAAREATDTAAGGLTSEPNQPRHPHGIRGDRHHPAPPFSTAPRRRFQPPSTPAAYRNRGGVSRSEELSLFNSTVSEGGVIPPGRRGARPHPSRGGWPRRARSPRRARPALRPRSRP